MTVVTDRHTYLFDLVASAAAQPLYVLRFTYPAEPQAGRRAGGREPAPTAEASRRGAASRMRRSTPPRSTSPGRARAQRKLLPARIYDDGAATFLAWPAGSPVPGDPGQGRERRRRPGQLRGARRLIVVDGVPREIVLRSGKRGARTLDQRRAGAAAPAAGVRSRRSPAADTPRHPAGENDDAPRHATAGAKARRHRSPTIDDPREGESAEIIDLASRTAYPAVTQRKGKSDGLGLAAGVGVVALLGAVTLWSMNAARTGTAEAAGGQRRRLPQPVAVPAAGGDAGRASRCRSRSPGAVRADPAPQPVLAAHAAGELAPVPARQPLRQPRRWCSTPGAARCRHRRGRRRRHGRRSDPANATTISPAASAASAAAPRRRRAMVDPETTVTQGTLIPAVLETAIDTDVPGYVRAVVEPGRAQLRRHAACSCRARSRLIGQYQSGLQAGQKRAYVIWTRLIRPDGVSVDLASPGDRRSTATTGLAGKVNSHFFERFGSAMLLSVIGGLSPIGGGARWCSAAAASAAATALQQDGQIGPDRARAPGRADPRVHRARPRFRRRSK